MMLSSPLLSCCHHGISFVLVSWLCQFDQTHARARQVRLVLVKVRLLLSRLSIRPQLENKRKEKKYEICVT